MYPTRLILQCVGLLFFSPVLDDVARSAPQDADRESSSPLIRVVTKDGKSTVGELLEDNDANIVVFDIGSSAQVTIPKSEVSRTYNPISTNDATRYVELPQIVAWQIGKLAAKDTSVGKVARVTSQVVYVTLGEKNSVSVGQTLWVYRNKGEIKDPDTGVVLAVERPRIAELELVEVNAEFSKGKIKGDFEVALNVGDEVETPGRGLVIAVCPLANEDGSSNLDGTRISEELTAILVQRELRVVERSHLDDALTELIAQNTILFDEKSAQKIGKLTGATAVLTGKIVPGRSTDTAFVRVVDVQTGEILSAATTAFKPTSPRGKGRQSSSSGRSSRTESRRPNDGTLGSSRSLPASLETNGGYQKSRDGGIRLQEKVVVRTKAGDYLGKDFRATFTISFQPDDRIAYLGLGPGEEDVSYNGLTGCVYMRFHAPDLARGLVDVETFRKGQSTLGEVPVTGTHLVEIIKEGDSVTFRVDPQQDGESDDDLQYTIPDIKQQAPFFNSKNMQIFVTGNGTFYSIEVD